MTASPANIERLLRHQDWVRALARSLVADPARAEDVAQQTMLEAIERAPRDLKQPMGWLATVARNAARAFARSDRRRQARELAVAKSEVDTADPAEAAQRAAAHKGLVDELFELPEPYHTVVLLRYFEDLEPQQIATQLGRSVSTVRTQLQRGLARMRERLDARHGGRAELHAALLPLFAPKQAAALTAAGVPILAGIGSLMMWKVLLSAAAAVSLLLFGMQALWAEPTEVPSGGSVSGGSPAQVSTANVDAGAPDAVREPGVAEPVPAAVPLPEPASPSEPELPRFAARVVHVDGSPAVGVTMAYRAPGSPRLEGTRLVIGHTVTDIAQSGLRESMASAMGRFRLALEYGKHAKAVLALLSGEPVPRPRSLTDGRGHLELSVPASSQDVANDVLIEREGWMVYGDGKLPGERQSVIVVGPCSSVAGVVVDESGQPIEDVYLHVGYTLDSLPGFPQRLEQTRFRSWHAHTLSSGSFTLGDVPRHRGVRVVAQKRGYQSVSVAAQDIDGPVRWTLKPKAERKRPQLTGIVRHVDGSPAKGAWVVFGYGRGLCDDEGRFSFDKRSARANTDLVAYLKDVQPAVRKRFGEQLREDPSLAEGLELRLGPAAVSIAGRVVDGEGLPVRNALVVLADGTTDGNSSQFVESIVGRQSNKGERTDAGGRFELKGLSQRNYTVRVIDEARHLVVLSEPVAPGASDFVLTVDGAQVAPLAGVVVDRLGNAVAAASVQLMTPSLETAAGTYWCAMSETVQTDASGRFEFARCPKQHAWLDVRGADVAWKSLAATPGAAPLRVVVKRMHKLRLRVTSSLAADRFAVVDEQGQRIATTRHSVGVNYAGRVHPIDAEQQPYYVVDDRAVGLVLLRGKQEVGRVPLDLRLGQFTIVDI